MDLVGTCAECVVFFGGFLGLAVFQAGGCCDGDVDTEVQEVEAKASGLHKQRSVCTHGLRGRLRNCALPEPRSNAMPLATGHETGFHTLL